MVKIGHARISEHKTIDGERGDQNKAEVSITEYYNKPWGYVIRAKNLQMGLRIANAMKMICSNDNIGYGQHFRNDIITEGEKVDWIFKDIKKPINCDCSSAVTACVINAGISKSKVYKGNSMTTRNMRTTLEKTGEFDVIPVKSLKPEDLMLGDILLAEGSHTAVVVEIDEVKEKKNQNKEKTDNNYFPAYDGKGVSIINALNDIGCKDWSKLYRSKLAVANNICENMDDYQGTAEQNLKLLSLLREGKLKRV